ncbi:hypothetical protein VB735_25375 [Halotia wernerae UHCC 0503]|nr:hypothetical protein [Halotia wernerae UHCC 0503]
MSLWILTTGNSDVILKENKNWGSLYNEVRYDLECTEFALPPPKDLYNKEAGFIVPARLLGLVYKNQPNSYESDLKFPLLDTYYQYFIAEKIKPERIILLLTDQSNIFEQDQIIYEKCPYWQDTCTFKPLFEWYFKNKLGYLPDFLYLTPKQKNKGIDNWDETLSLVKEEIHQLEYNPSKTVYLSHQAGTPAISSAVQFVSLGKFSKVQFLVSNEYVDENYEQKSQSEVIASSNYWRGMQIQKAKQLIITGFPGAALKILEQIDGIDQSAIAELNKMVDFFNLHSSLANSAQELTIPQATQRIVDTLDLITFFFSQKNYLQGITLLAAAQETFLKVGVMSQVAMINDTVMLNGSSKKVSELLEWLPSGLQLSNFIASESKTFKQNILQKMKLNNVASDFRKLNKNSTLIKWLKNIDVNFSCWPLLEWYCNDKRKHDDDIRNQFMHNLCGVEDNEVIKYLLGYPESITVNGVLDAYTNYVKQPLLSAINYFKLPYKKEKLNKKLQEIADLFV